MIEELPLAPVAAVRVQPSPPPAPWRNWLVHFGRIALLLTLVWLIRLQHAEQWQQAQLTWLPLSRIQVALPEAEHLGQLEPRSGAVEILAADGELLGYALQTAPAANRFIGFSGPTNLLLIFDREGRLSSVEILSSGDTREHVALIAGKPEFLGQLRGEPWADLTPQRLEQIDAVSGATLTSLAMLRGLAARLGGQLPNLLFPDDPPVDWVADVFPGAVSLDVIPDLIGVYAVRDEAAAVIGYVLRSTPAGDNEIGYQGPTEALLCIQPPPATDDHQSLAEQLGTGTVLRLIIARSYDNLEYVRLVRNDWAFPEILNGQKLTDIARNELTLDGVSGATMTSRAVLRSVQAAIRGIHPAAEQSADVPQPVVLAAPSGWRDWLLLSCIGTITTLGLSRWRGNSWVRLCTQLLSIGGLGLLSGALLSQAMLHGWARTGIPAQHALGLLVLTGVAGLAPVLWGRNLYCSHLCPHGVAQQLLGRWCGSRQSVGRRANSFWRRVPAVLLIACLLITLGDLPLSLVDLEPFDAWVLGVGGLSATVLAVAGLLAACRWPLAYCRYGCPTGALLEFLRRHNRSGLLTLADGVLLGIVGWATWLTWS
jgi:uncharacterized protein with FMN-binding domain